MWDTLDLSVTSELGSCPEKVILLSEDKGVVLWGDSEDSVTREVETKLAVILENKQ